MVKALRFVQIDPVLPGDLKALKDIASNLWWCWNQEAIQLFMRMDSSLWVETGHNPMRMLGMISQEKLYELDEDDSFKAHLERVHKELKEYLKSESWFSKQHFKTEKPEIAYFSAEFGLAESMPIYSGGLGILAGDHLKSASDLGIPLVGIGLLYQYGYFQQYLNADGWQQEYYPQLDFSTLPVEEAMDKNGQPLIVDIDFPNRKVYIKVWLLNVGRIPLYLLDTNIPQNNQDDRNLTGHLYGGDNETRIQQEMILGIGGIRALHAMDIYPTVCHMNEGHSAFLALERVRAVMDTYNLSFWKASILIRQTTVFTTHTPVPAGIDRFHRSLIEKYLKKICDNLKLNFEEFFQFGSEHGAINSTEFNMAHLAMKFSSYINGVSKLHSQVSREMWKSSWKNVPIEEVPIAGITNGVHARTWISPEMSYLYDRYLGNKWRSDSADHGFWRKIKTIPDGELWRTHGLRKERMISFIRKRLKQQIKRRGGIQSQVQEAGEVLNSEYLTIGFARRFATYKRGTLIFRDIERLKKILNNPKYPIQLIFAGKAHPRDNHGKELIKQIIHLARDPELRNRIAFLENYDMTVARYLVQGVDIWLNTPRRPMEASGTSGMKVIFNGGLNLSVLDGWWVEGFNPETGWAIGGGESYENYEYQDEIEANALYNILEKEIAPLYYDRSGDGIPRRWVTMMKSSIMQLAPRFNSDRMVQEYNDRFYLNAYRQGQILRNRDMEELHSLADWYKQLKDKWADIRIVEVTSNTPDHIGVNHNIEVESRVFVGELTPEDIAVELYIGKLAPNGTISDAKSIEMVVDSDNQSGICNFRCSTSFPTSGRLGYSVRVLPGHRSLIHPFELGLITWADGDL